MNTLKSLKEVLNEFWSFLEGKKTYITTVILAFYGVLKAFKIVDFTPDQDVAVLALIGAMLGLSIREAINKK